MQTLNKLHSNSKWFKSKITKQTRHGSTAKKQSDTTNKTKVCLQQNKDTNRQTFDKSCVVVTSRTCLHALNYTTWHLNATSINRRFLSCINTQVSDGVNFFIRLSSRKPTVFTMTPSASMQRWKHNSGLWNWNIYWAHILSETAGVNRGLSQLIFAPYESIIHIS